MLQCVLTSILGFY